MRWTRGGVLKRGDSTTMPTMHGFTPDFNKTIAEADEELNEDGVAPLAQWSRDEPVYCAVMIHRTPGLDDRRDYRVTISAETDDVDIDAEWFDTRTAARSRCFDFMRNTTREEHAPYTPDTQTNIPTQHNEGSGLSGIRHNLNTEKIVRQYHDVANNTDVAMDHEPDVRAAAFGRGNHMLCLALDRDVRDSEKSLYMAFHEHLSDSTDEEVADASC